MLKTMSKICGGIAIIILATALYIDVSREEGFSISEEEAQVMIDKRLQEKPLLVNKLGAQIMVREAKVDFLASPTAKTKVDAIYSAHGYGLSGDGSIQFEALLHYDSGEVFLRDLQVIEHKFQFDDPEKAQRIRGAAANAMKKLGAFVSEATQKLDPTRREALKDLRVRSLDSVKKQAVNAAVGMLQSKPVYSFHGKDMKRTLVAMSVASLQTDDRAAHVKLRLENTFKATALYIISGILALVAVLGFVLSRRS